MRRWALIFAVIVLLFMSGCSEEADRMVEEDIVDYLDAASFRAGKVKGLQISIGTSFDEVIRELGDPLEKDYYKGGLYLMYELEEKPYDVFFFGYDVGVVQHIMLFPKDGLSLDMVREKLGEADSDRYDDSLNEAWIMMYDYKNYSLYVEAVGAEKNGQVWSLFLKQENL